MLHSLRVVTSIIGVLWLIWTAYALIAPEPEDQLPIGVMALDTSAPQSSQPGLDVVSVLARHLGTPITTGNRVELLINGNEIFPPMLEAIEQAKHSIRFLTYVYWTGDIADQFAAALTAAAARGVSVRVMLDAFGARHIDSKHLERMRSAGATIAWFHPFKWYNIRQLNRRTHRKILVVDTHVGFVGGVGIASEWTGDAHSADHWRDNHFRVVGPAVRYIEGAFAENWLNATGELLTATATQTMNLASEDGMTGPARALVLPTSPRGDMSPIALAYWTAFASAKTSIDIATPYYVPDASLQQAIIGAAMRGVRVRLLIPVRSNDSTLVRWASQANFQELVSAGVEIYDYTSTMMHSKLVLIDSTVAIVGSSNFDNRSFELNDEIVLILDDKQFAKQLGTSYEHDIADAIPVTPAEARLGIMQRIAAHATLLLQEQL